MRGFVKLHDSTLRDGNHAAGHSIPLSYIQLHCDFAEKCGIHSVEVGHGNGLGASSLQVGLSPYSDEEIISTARSALNNTKLAVHVIPGFATYDSDVSPAIDYGVDIFRVGTHCTEASISYSLLDKLCSQRVEVVSALMMSHMSTKEELLSASLILQDKGVNGISIYDSAGCLDQDDVKDIISYLADNLDVQIGFHGHNNLGLAIANSFQSYISGASLIDASICGFGAGAGNTQLETLASYMEKKGIDTGLDICELFYMSDFASSTYCSIKPATDPITIACSLNGLFSGFKKHILKASKVYDVDPFLIIRDLGSKKIVAGQEDQIYVSAKSLAGSNEKINSDGGKPLSFQLINNVFPYSQVKNIDKVLFERRRFYSECSTCRDYDFDSNLLKFEINNISERGFHYYDGSRETGYGGYNPFPEKWNDLARLVISEFNLGVSSKILDIGCAKGFFVEALINNGIKDAWGTDISKYAIESASLNVRQRLFVQSGLRLPFPDKYFDFLFSLDTLQEIPFNDLPFFLKEIKRVSNKSLLLIPVPSPSSIDSFKSWSIMSECSFTKEDWLVILKDLGYNSYVSFTEIEILVN
jgi:4-hydroxy 2-oxovalerate aldolase